jgi:hypothetical protein
MTHIEQAVSEQLRQNYLRRYGLRPMPPNCWPTTEALIWRARRTSDILGSSMNCRGPHADHNRGFYNPLTEEIVGTEQPYFGQPPATLEQVTQDVEAFAAAHGLTVRVSTEESWHCPGRTVLIEYRKI